LRLTNSSSDRHRWRWIWVAFFLLVILPLYAIAVTVCIRSNLFRFGSGSLDDTQLKTVWTFLGAGLAAAATMLGALLAKSHNDRKEILESAAHERLKLDTVVSALKLISHDGDYSPKAMTAAGLATLVQLGHPFVAMRALGPAYEDHAVDVGTFTWLISQVLTADTTAGTRKDLVDAKEEAAALLRQRAATDLTSVSGTGRFSWPEAIQARWPSGLSRNAERSVVLSIADLLLSQSKEWWTSGGATYTWAIYTLDEAVRHAEYDETKKAAAALGQAFLAVTDLNEIVGINDVRDKSEVAERMAEICDDSANILEPGLAERIQAWGEAQRGPRRPFRRLWRPRSRPWFTLGPLRQEHVPARRRPRESPGPSKPACSPESGAAVFARSAYTLRAEAGKGVALRTFLLACSHLGTVEVKVRA
jgi:hypothetical protein